MKVAMTDGQVPGVLPIVDFLWAVPPQDFESRRHRAGQHKLHADRQKQGPINIVKMRTRTIMTHGQF